MSYTIRKQLFGWFLTFEYDLMGNLPLWGTLKNDERTLKNGPKYAKNLEMTWIFFAKRCWQPCSWMIHCRSVCGVHLLPIHQTCATIYYQTKPWKLGHMSVYVFFGLCILEETTNCIFAEYLFIYFSMGVFFHNHSWTTGLQGKGEGISLTPHYHFHLLHWHLDISWVISAESSSLHIAMSRTRTGNLWFRSTSC